MAGLKPMLKSPDKAYFWKTVFVFHLCNAIFAELSVKPQNTLTKLGNDASLNCCSNQPTSVLEWKFQKWKNGELFVKICSGKTCQTDGYSIDSSVPDCSNLNINSSASNVAGLYQCNEVDTEAVGGAYLVVYQLSCQGNFSGKGDLVEGHKVVFNCTASWDGKLPFAVTLTTANRTQIQKILFSERQEFYSSSMAVLISRPRLPSFTASIQFLVTLVTDKHVDTHSPVVSWSSSEEQVMYPVSNIRTNCPNKECEKKKGDLVNCSADGFPVPEFQWLDWDLTLVATSSVLQLGSVGTFEYTCISKNTIRGQNYETREKVVVTVSEETTGMSQTTTVVIVVGVTAIVIIIVVLVLVSVITRVVLQVANVYLSENENTCTRSESGTRKRELDEIQLQSKRSPVPAKNDGHFDNDLEEETIGGNKDRHETERLFPVRQVDDAYS